MTDEDSKPRNKVAIVSTDRKLEDLPGELEQRWHGVGYDEHSVRELTDFFNRRVIEDAITATGEVPLDGEVANYYRLLTTEDIGTGSTVQARSRLSEYGVDPDALEADLVSHQTMYRYLKDVRGVDTSSERKSITELLESTRTAVRRLNSRTQTVVRRNIEQLNKRDEFTTGEFDILVNVQFTCTDCGKTGDVVQIMDNFGCDCKSVNETDASSTTK